MCNGCNTHDALDDSIDDLFGGVSTAPVTRQTAIPTKDISTALLDETQSWTEKCTACRGTGTFYSWAGRPVGPCRRCNGRGSKTFKTSPTQRNQNKQRYEAKKAERADQAHRDATAWVEANPEEYAWMKANPNFEFAASVREALFRNGYLTDGQLAAVRRCIARNKEREAAKQAAIVQQQEAAPTCSVSKIEDAFAVAMGNGVKRPKLRLDTFIFSPAPEHGNNAGSIYVVDAATRNYLGKITNCKFLRVRMNCTEEQEAAIVAAASDPEASAKAYGQRTGNCSVCGKGLTRNDSIDRMMGPICAEKYGW